MRAKLKELATALAVQNMGLTELTWGSTGSLEDVVRRATSNGYVDAYEAPDRG